MTLSRRSLFRRAAAVLALPVAAKIAEAYGPSLPAAEETCAISIPFARLPMATYVEGDCYRVTINRKTQAYVSPSRFTRPDLSDPLQTAMLGG